jgi:hypothetical protein
MASDRLTRERREPLRGAVLINSVRYWSNALICEKLVGLMDECDALESELREAKREGAREEAKRIYTNWNVHDRDFGHWLEQHIAALPLDAPAPAASGPAPNAKDAGTEVVIEVSADVTAASDGIVNDALLSIDEVFGSEDDVDGPAPEGRGE